jgi:hypothetical protein
MEGDAAAGTAGITGGADLDGGSHRVVPGDARRPSATTKSTPSIAACEEGDPIYDKSQLGYSDAVGGGELGRLGGSMGTQGMNIPSLIFCFGSPSLRADVVDFEDLKTNPFSVNWNPSNNHLGMSLVGQIRLRMIFIMGMQLGAVVAGCLRLKCEGRTWFRGMVCYT